MTRYIGMKGWNHLLLSGPARYLVDSEQVAPQLEEESQPPDSDKEVEKSWKRSIGISEINRTLQDGLVRADGVRIASSMNGTSYVRNIKSNFGNRFLQMLLTQCQTKASLWQAASAMTCVARVDKSLNGDSTGKIGKGKRKWVQEGKESVVKRQAASELHLNINVEVVTPSTRVTSWFEWWGSVISTGTWLGLALFILRFLFHLGGKNLYHCGAGVLDGGYRNPPCWRLVLRFRLFYVYIYKYFWLMQNTGNFLPGSFYFQPARGKSLKSVQLRFAFMVGEHGWSAWMSVCYTSCPFLNWGTSSFCWLICNLKILTDF